MGEDGLQFFWRHYFKLSEGARGWLAVGAPTAKMGHVPETSALHVLVCNLDDEFGAERLPGKVFSLTPAAFAAGHAMFAGFVVFFGAFPMLPRMIAQGVFAKGCNEIEKLAAHFGGEACADADVLQ